MRGREPNKNNSSPSQGTGRRLVGWESSGWGRKGVLRLRVGRRGPKLAGKASTEESVCGESRRGVCSEECEVPIRWLDREV